MVTKSGAAKSADAFQRLPPSITDVLSSSAALIYREAPLLEALIRDLAKEADDLRKKGDPMELARAFVALHRMHAVFKVIIGEGSIFSGLYNTYKSDVLPKAFDDGKIDGHIPLAEGFRVTVAPKLNASIKDDKKDRAFEWLRENDLEDLITEVVNAGSLTYTARTMIDEGKELPEDIFSVYYSYSTSVTKVAVKDKPPVTKKGKK